MVLHRLLLLFLALLSAPVAHAALLGAPEATFREAKVRLLAQREADGRLIGAVQITLNEGFKTYWKNPGDSGVPPQFDFSTSTGVGDLAVRYPFPQVFDDGAGGKAFGYRHEVFLPFEGKAQAGGVLTLQFDFAVCGTLCIPLSARLQLDLAKGAVADPALAAALTSARARLPQTLGSEGVTLQREAEGAYSVTLPYDGATEGLQVYPQAPGFFEVKGIEGASPGRIRVRLSGQAAPGTKTLGPLSLTYGTPEASFERVVDVDGAG